MYFLTADDPSTLRSIKYNSHYSIRGSRYTRALNPKSQWCIREVCSTMGDKVESEQ